jgi:hypothetical protein
MKHNPLTDLGLLILCSVIYATSLAFDGLLSLIVIIIAAVMTLATALIILFRFYDGKYKHDSKDSLS